RPHRHRDPAHGAALPAAGAGAHGGARRVLRRGGLRVGAGGTGQPGRVVVHRPEPARAPPRGTAAEDLPSGGGRAGRRLDQAARRGAGRARRGRAPASVGRAMYFTDRGIEELAERRGDESVTLEWVAERLRDFLDLNPEFETPIERLATWLARLDEEDEDGDWPGAENR